MIEAKFIKAYTTAEGVTLVLKGVKSKNTLRLAAELQDEECIISVNNSEIPLPPSEGEAKLLKMIREYCESEIEAYKNKSKQFTLS